MMVSVCSVLSAQSCSITIAILCYFDNGRKKRKVKIACFRFEYYVNSTPEYLVLVLVPDALLTVGVNVT